MKKNCCALIWLFSLAFLSAVVSPAFAQSTGLADRPSPKIEVYPRYPVSDSFVPGPSIYINSGRASVSMVVDSAPCDESPGSAQVKRVITGNRIEVGPVRSAFDPICGFTGSHAVEVVDNVWLGELGPVNPQMGSNAKRTGPTSIRFPVITLFA